MKILRDEKYTLPAILFLGTILRLLSINQSFWLDEASSVINAQRFSFWGILTEFAVTDFHPPFYYLFLKVWMMVFGSSELVVRLPSVLFGMGTVFVLYLLIRQLFSKQVALVAAFLLTIAPLHVYYSQEARMYSLETLLVTLSVLFFTKLLAVPSKKLFFLFTFTNMVLVYTDYLPAFIFIIYICWMLWRRKDIATLAIRYVLLSFVVTIVSFIPFTQVLGVQLQHGSNATQSLWSNVLGSLHITTIPLLFVKFMIGRIAFSQKIIYLIFVLIPTLLYCYLFVQTVLKRDKNIYLLYVWLGIPIILGAVLSIKLSVFDYFRFLYVLPAFYSLAAVGLFKLPSRLRLLLLGLLCVSSITSLVLYYTNKTFQREDWRSAVQYIESHETSSAITVFVNADQADPYRYYTQSIVPFSGPALFYGSSYKKIWLMRYVQDIFDPKDHLRQYIEEAGYKKVREHDFNKVIVWEYEKM